MLRKHATIPELEAEDAIYRVKPSTIPMPDRPRFFMGDYLETDDKAYRLTSASCRRVDRRFTEWEWLVEEIDKKTGEVKRYTVKETEWAKTRAELKAPPYPAYWSWLPPRIERIHPMITTIMKIPVRRRLPVKKVKGVLEAYMEGG